MHTPYFIPLRQKREGEERGRKRENERNIFNMLTEI
jgi:hypothetical protein